MRTLAVWILSGVMCVAQTVASKRHEILPFQIGFSSYSAPFGVYANANNYSTVPDAQLCPNDLNVNNNVFASTGDFTTIQQTDMTTTFGVASNVGTITTGSSSSQTFEIGSTATSFAGPHNCADVEIDQNGTTSGTDQIFLVMGTATTEIGARIDAVAGTALISTTISGTTTTFGSVAFSLPTAPWRLRLVVINQAVEIWKSTGTSGTGWTFVTSANVSGAIDPTLASNLTNMKTAVKLFTSQTTTWKLSNLRTGGYGGVGVQTVHIVQTPDGRPYMQGSKVYFTASMGTAVSITGNGAWELCTVDLIANTMSFISVIMDSRNSGHVYNDTAGQLIYNPLTGDQFLLTGTWATDTSTGSVTTNYRSFNTSSMNLFSPGIHVVSASPTTLSFPTISTNSYDPSLVCVQWNFGANTCSKWIIAITASNNGYLESTTSDPSANSWTQIGTNSANLMEGSRIIRYPDGPSGVAYYAAWVGQVGGSVRYSRIYDMSFNQLGQLAVSWPPAAGAFNPAHPMIFAYGNKWYMLTFDDTLFSVNSAMGNLILYTANRYPSIYPSGPRWYGGASIGNGASSSSTVVATVPTIAGGMVTAWCANGGASPPTSITSSASDTFIPSPSGASGVSEMFYTLAAAGSGNVTYTCNQPSSVAFGSLIVNTYYPSQVSIAENAASGTGLTSSSMPTTGTDLVMFCGIANGSGNYILPGSIGSNTGIMRSQLGSATSSSTISGCADTVLLTPQSSVVGAMTAPVASGPLYSMIAFKYGPTSGTYNHARTFNGTSDYLVSASNITGLNGSTTGSMSFRMLWSEFSNDGKNAFATTNAFPSGSPMIRPNESTTGLFAIWINGPSGALKCGFSRPSAGTWHSYVFTWNLTAQTCQAYVDGVSQSISINQTAGASTFGSFPLYVMSVGGSSNFGSGSVSEIAFYTGTISAGDAASLAGCGRATSVSSATLVYYWPINQTSPEIPTTGSINLNVTGTSNAQSNCSF